MKIKGLIYQCENPRCINYYRMDGAKKLVIGLNEYFPDKVPLCFYCFKKMHSELERNVKALKQELNLS